MALTPRLRKLALTTHVMASVGWLGAVVAFLALSLAGLTSQDPQIVQGAYRVMELTGWVVLVPFSLGSLATGLICSLGSAWGLFRHYWVLAKLVLNVLATALLLLHTTVIDAVAAAAARGPLSPADLADPRRQLVADSAAALVLLLLATTLGVLKPRGLTRYGGRKQLERRA